MVYGLPEVQGLGRRNEMVRTAGEGLIIPAVQTPAWVQSIKKLTFLLLLVHWTAPGEQLLSHNPMDGIVYSMEWSLGESFAVSYWSGVKFWSGNWTGLVWTDSKTTLGLWLDHYLLNIFHSTPLHSTPILHSIICLTGQVIDYHFGFDKPDLHVGYHSLSFRLCYLSCYLLSWWNEREHSTPKFHSIPLQYSTPEFCCKSPFRRINSAPMNRKC